MYLLAIAVYSVVYDCTLSQFFVTDIQKIFVLFFSQVLPYWGNQGDRKSLRKYWTQVQSCKVQILAAGCKPIGRV